MLYRFWVRSSKTLKEFTCSMIIHITATKMKISKFCKTLQLPILHQTAKYVCKTTPFPYCNIYLILNQGFSLLLPQNTYLTLQFITSPIITERASEENRLLNSIFILLAEKHVFPLLSDRSIELNTSSVWKKQGLNQSC